MIEQDVIDHLKADTTLDGLLSSSASDSKIYPVRASQQQQENVPCIVYSVTGIDTDEIIDEDIIDFKIIDDDYAHAKQIQDRLLWLLNISDDLRIGAVSTSISSSTYYIYYGKRTGGAEFQDPDTLRYVKVETYNFKFKRKIA